jgi:hypothetical protein
MIVAHSGPWGGKSCASNGAPQVVIGITVAAGKIWAGEPEDGVDLRSGFALREQIPGDPEIHDAPVRLRKAFENMPSLQATPIDRGGLFRRWLGRAVWRASSYRGARADTKEVVPIA